MGWIDSCWIENTSPTPFVLLFLPLGTLGKLFSCHFFIARTVTPLKAECEKKLASLFVDRFNPKYPTGPIVETVLLLLPPRYTHRVSLFKNTRVKTSQKIDLERVVKTLVPVEYIPIYDGRVSVTDLFFFYDQTFFLFPRKLLQNDSTSRQRRAIGTLATKRLVDVTVDQTLCQKTSRVHVNVLPTTD